MVNPFYTASGAPVTSSTGASAVQRAEFLAIQTAFDKLPVLTASTVVGINAGGTAMTNLTVTGTGNVVLAVAPTLTGPVAINLTSNAAVSEVLQARNNGVGAGTLAQIGFYAASTRYAGITGGFSSGGLGASLLLDISGTTIVTLSAVGVGIGVTPAAILHFKGASQTTAALTDAGVKTGVLWADTTDESIGSGGGVIFGTTGHQFAAIKSLLQNGAGNYAGDLAFSTRNATGDIALTERLRLISTGQFGIGMTPTNILDITQTQNAASTIQIYNATNNTAAVAQVRALNNAGSSIIMRMFSSGFTPGSMDLAGGGTIVADGPGGLVIKTGANQPVYIGVNNVEVARFISSGLTVTGVSKGNSFNSSQGTTGPIANNTPVTIGGCGSTGGGIVFAYINGNGLNYVAYAVFNGDTVNFQLATLVNAPNLSITLVGGNTLKVTQNTGGVSTVTYSITYFG